MVEFKDSDVIKSRGIIGRFIWVIYEGTADVTEVKSDGSRRVRATIKKGEIIGEMSIMTGEPGSADIVAKKDCSLIKIPREIFSSIIVKNSSALAKVASIITKRLIRKDLDEQAGVAQKLAISQSEMDDPYNLLFTSSDISIKILVINCGSSSIKYSLFDTSKRQYQLEGLIEKINKPQSFLTIKCRGKEIKKTLSSHGIAGALEEMTKSLVDPALGLLMDLNEISAVGHRVVHGGEKLYASVVITDEIKNTIKEYSA
ncbi:MAG: cyclic nucleotide-binding domain-containing protein, partial [Nitrospirae bacterium]|nr:cyclic nucleotide-binding domain-containing protein [Nitrospirota bacterium]